MYKAKRSMENMHTDVEVLIGLSLLESSLLLA